jgi:antitoxin component YwqK of YwqJK toxin-antitoxin module
VIRARLAEISMKPDSKGIARDFHANGALKATGRMKDGELHGAWSWWRADGTLMRTGSFDRGRQVGEWTTYDAAGRPARTTDKGR